MDGTLDFGVIGNCMTAALVSRRGAVEWLCFPDFDDPAIFAALLDGEKGGRFGFHLPEGCECRQHYLADTNILRTRFDSAEGSFEVIDFMPRYRISQSDYYNPPEIYRLLRPLRGRPRLGIDYNPRMQYARWAPVHEKYKDYLRTASENDPNDNVYLYTGLDFDLVLDGREFVLEKEEFLLLAYNQKLVTIDLDRVYLEFERTKVYWLNWANRSVKFEKYGELTGRSLLVLKLMTFERSGAILAALTTSIPETAGAERNWDYRYCWLRDASMSITTLLRMNHRHAALRFLGFIKSIIRSKQDTFQIMYGIRGERILSEETLGHLAGFAGSKPVRVGNAAYTQKQNDALGYLLDVINTYYHHFAGPLDDIEEMWEIVKKVVKVVVSDWRNPDQSIWEFRQRREHFVFSKVMCWVALDRAAQIASYLGRSSYEARIRAHAAVIREDVFTYGWNEELQSFTQCYGSTDLDASLLLMEQYGFIEAQDQRYVRTVDRIAKELLHNDLMYRYKNADDFGLPSSAFTICTFWLIRALFVTGRRERARELFDKLITCRNHVGLLSEDLDFVTKRQLGNFPQAYSHLALIDVVELLTKKRFWSKFIQA